MREKMAVMFKTDGATRAIKRGEVLEIGWVIREKSSEGHIPMFGDSVITGMKMGVLWQPCYRVARAYVWRNSGSSFSGGIDEYEIRGAVMMKSHVVVLKANGEPYKI